MPLKMKRSQFKIFMIEKIRRLHRIATRWTEYYNRKTFVIKEKLYSINNQFKRDGKFCPQITFG